MHKGKILIADDDPAILEVLKLVLSVEGYSVSTASNGKAVKYMKKYPDLLLQDIQMSGSDGRDTCLYLKKKRATAKMPVIFISANKDLSKISKEAGADAYLSKPFDINHLVKTVKNT